MMSTHTTSGNRLVEWAELTDERVPDDLRERADGEG